MTQDDSDEKMERLERPPRLGSLPSRIELGLIAFLPAFVLLSVRAYSCNPSLVFCLFMVLAIVSAVLVIGLVFVVALKGGADSHGFESIEDESGDVLGHVGSYILPVVVDVQESPMEVWLAAAALVLILIIHISTGRIHVNPLLYLFGYRVYTARSSKKGLGGQTVSYYLIAHSDVAEWKTERECVQVGESMLFEKRTN